jgi:hypothetical protein
MSYTTSPNMGLVVPTVGSEAGPLYASDINNSLTLVDGHNHSAGQGVQIQPSGLNISSALTFQANPITNLGYANFYLQSGAPPLTQSLYVQNGSEGTPRPDLWYYDGITAVQLTSAGTVNAIASSIPGESYSAGTFTWRQGSGSTTPANFDIGSTTIRPNTAGTTLGTTIIPASGLAGSTTFTLPSVNVQMPTSLPLGTSFLTLDSSGNVGTSSSVAASQIATGSIIGSQLANQTISATQIANSTITGAQIASSTVTGSNIAASTITYANISPGGIIGSSLAGGTITGGAGGQISTSGTITPANLSISSLYRGVSTGAAAGTNTSFSTLTTLTVSGRGVPFLITLQSDGSGNSSFLGQYNASGPGTAYFRLLRNGSEIAQYNITANAIGTTTEIPASSFLVLDTPGVGSFTYSLQVKSDTTSTAWSVNYALLAAKELL